MTQYVINIGALPNDGTGDPLRTAFNDVNLNFDQVFAAGPVLSNIRIANNSIITTNTNGNLVLAPNGTGKILASTDLLPGVSNVRNLGSLNNRWNTVYTQFAQINQANIASFGNLTVDVGNLHISGGSNGYVLQTDGTGNLTWTAQTGGSGNGVPGGANTQIQFNDSGAFGGASGFTFDSTSNVMSVPGNIATTGNITGSYIFGNGSQLTGLPAIYGNANVQTYLPTYTGNLNPSLVFTGNTIPSFVANNIGLVVNNGDSPTAWVGPYDAANTASHGYLQLSSQPLANGAEITTDSEFFNITNAGSNGIINLSTGYLGDQTWTFDNTGKLTLPGNIGAVGPVGMGWPGFVSTNGYLSIQGLNSVESASPGQIQSEIFLWNSDDAGHLDITLSDFTASPSPTTNSWRFSPDGNLAVPGSIVINNTQALYAYDANGITLTANVQQDVNGFSSQYLSDSAVYANSNVQIISDAAGSELTWTFVNQGSVDFPITPSNQRTGSGNNLKFTKSNNQKIVSTDAGTADQNTVERLVIAGGDSYRDPNTSVYSGEGGDIYLWAGRGQDGGDIKVDAGDAYDTYGGTVKVRAGGSYAEDGQGGFLELRAGGAGQTGGVGGNVDIFPGYGQDTGGSTRIFQAGGSNAWTFDATGNLTLPSNTFAVNYANGTPVSIGGGGGNATPVGFAYGLGDPEVAGAMSINNTDPALVTEFVINPETDQGTDIDTLMTYFVGQRVIATVADSAGASAQYAVNTITPFTTSYQGYLAVFTKQWGDDPAISKIAIYPNTATATAVTQADTNDDEFTVNLNGSANGVLATIVLYTENSDFVPTNQNLTAYFEAFVDNCLVPYAGNITSIRAAFYDNLATTTGIMRAWGEGPYDNFEFWDNGGTNSIYRGVSPTSSNSIAGGSFELTSVITAGDGTYRMIDGFSGGINYAPGDVITFDGTMFGGVSVTNDLIVTVATVDGSGAVTAYSSTGLMPGIWPSDSISDGGDDQYDTGNFLKTNNQQPVPYGYGEIQNGSAFGGNDFFVGYAYSQFVFVGNNNNGTVNQFGTYGETGADGDGSRETGALNTVLYYTFGLDSVLDYAPAVNLTTGFLTITFDVAGALSNGVIFPISQENTITAQSGDLYITAPDDIRIQPTDDLRLFAGNKQPGASNSGGDISIEGGRGSDAANNNDAGRGGDIEITAGSAGSDTGNAQLGDQGGSIQIYGGSSSGNDNGGDVVIYGGSGSGTGTRGTVAIDQGNGRWQFGSVNSVNTLSLPFGSTIREVPSPLGGGYAMDLAPQGANDPNQLLKIYPTTNEGNHVHLTSGNLLTTDIFLGDDTQYVRTDTTGAMVIGTDSGAGAIGGYQWRFDTVGAVTLPVIGPGEGTGESVTIKGTRSTIGGYDAPAAYTVQVSQGGAPQVVYTATTNAINSVRITFAVQRTGAGYLWEQFDVVAVRTNSNQDANYTVSNYVASDSGAEATVVSAQLNGDTGCIEIVFTLNPAFGGYINYTAVEFALMVD